MTREKRKISETGIYHIMLKGIDGRNIFMDNEDREKLKTQYNLIEINSLSRTNRNRIIKKI